MRVIKKKKKKRAGETPRPVDFSKFFLLHHDLSGIARLRDFLNIYPTPSRKAKKPIFSPPPKGP